MLRIATASSKISFVFISAVPVLPACGGGARAIDWDRFERPAPGEPARLAADEDGLAAAAGLEPMLQLAQARDPELLEARDRAHASVASVAAAGRLPDLELKYEQWGVPLARPWALDEAGMLMLGLRQAFPAAGSLGAEARAAREDATGELDRLRARRLDVGLQVRRAYYEYVRAWQEYDLHLEHATLAQHIIELARAQLRTARGSQQGVLSLGLELTRLHRDLTGIEQRKRSQAALLNALMGRAPDAPLGPPPAPDPVRIDAQVAELERRGLMDRPEIAAAQHVAARSAAEVEAAERRASWPTFMVGVDYWYQPTSETRHAYAAMLSMTLPWLNPEHRERAEAARWTAAADRRAIDSMRSTIRYEVHDAYARYQAARAALTLIDEDLVPRARQSLEAAQAAYASGGSDAITVIDALRRDLEARLDRIGALVDLDESAAALERATGGERR